MGGLVALLCCGLLASLAPVAADGDAGWRFVDVAIEPISPQAGDLLTLAFTVLDEAGQPLPELAVTAALRAPITGYNQPPPPPAATVRGQGGEQPGRYEVRVPLNTVGRWWVEVELNAPGGRHDRLSRFIVVEPRFRIPETGSQHLVFFRGERWKTYYRVDPATGQVALLGGDEVLRAGQRWLVTERRLSPVDRVSQAYGGRWNLSLVVTDGQTGERAGEVQLGEVRAAVPDGSSSSPALVSAVAADPSGARLYAYWAWKLGQGWNAQLATVDLEGATVVETRIMLGALLGERVVPQLAVSGDGQHLVVAEQVVRVEPESGFRLTVLRTSGLEVEASHRSPGEATTPWAGCPITYPGMSGLATGPELRWYALCAGGASGPVLLIWDPVAGQVTQQIDVSELKTASPALAIAGQTLYAVASWAPEAIAVDLVTGEVRRAQLTTAGEPPLSPIERIIRWLVGAVVSDAGAAGQPSRWVVADRQGQRLYVVAPVGGATGFGDGIWVLDAGSLAVVDRWLVGHPIIAVTVTDAGTVVAIERTEGAGDRALILDPAGEIEMGIALPGPISDTVVSG